MDNPSIVIDIVRVAQGDHGTFGVLLLDGKAFCVTLELPWRSNQRNVSCIPARPYRCQRIHSTRFGNAFLVRDAPNRSHILFHVGNTVGDTSGCILLGQRFGDQMILDSRKAFNAFMTALDGRETFKLTIKECLC